MAVAHAQMRVAAALAGGGCLTTEALATETTIAPEQIRKICCRLIRRGWVERRQAGCFCLSARGAAALDSDEIIDTSPIDPPAHAIPRRPHRRTVRDRVWKAMRVLGRFTVPELMEMAEAKRRTVLHFVFSLASAGYLRQLRREPSGGLNKPGHHRYLLVDNTGPAAPIQRASGEIYDPNTGETRGRRA